MNAEDIKIGYAVSYSSSTNGYLGAVLIADYRGFPVEFRYTDPITPTKIQQVLYGQGLEKYIKVDVIMDSLLRVLSNGIDLLFVQDEDLLRYKSDMVNIIRVSATKAAPLSEQGAIANVKGKEFLLQTSHSSNPVRLQFQDDFDCDGNEFQRIVETLTEVGKYIDVDEPLNRVYKSIELICAKEA